MRDRCERTISVAVSVERAWRAVTNPRELEAWFYPRVTSFETRPGGKLAYGFDDRFMAEGRVREVEPGRRLRWREEPGMLPGATEVTVALEPHRSGTRIAIVHTGFAEGAHWIDEPQDHALTWRQFVADLVLYLENGIRHPRYATRKCFIGVATVDVPAGVQIAYVAPGSFADHAGLRRDDLLLELGGAPLYGRSDLWFFGREHWPGEEVEVVWARGAELMRSHAVLSPRR
jgi:uncharacterized protein YndB with AHSA1/START domain